MSGLAGLSRGTRVPICPGAFCVPWDRDRDRSLRDERDRDKFSRDCPAGLSRGTSGTGTKIRGTVPSRPLPIPDWLYQKGLVRNEICSLIRNLKFGIFWLFRSFSEIMLGLWRKLVLNKFSEETRNAKFTKMTLARIRKLDRTTGIRGLK